MSLIKGLASRHSSNYGHTHTRTHNHTHTRTHTNIRTAYPQQSERWRRDLLKAFNGHCKNGWDSKSIFSSLCFIQRANVAICFETCTQTNTCETDDTAHREQLNLTSEREAIQLRPCQKAIRLIADFRFVSRMSDVCFFRVELRSWLSWLEPWPLELVTGQAADRLPPLIRYDLIEAEPQTSDQGHNPQSELLTPADNGSWNDWSL